MGEYNAYDRLKAKRKENSSSYNALESHKRNKANIVALDIYESIDSLNAAGSKEYDTYKSRFFDEDGNYINNYRGDAADVYDSFSKFKTKYDTESKKILNLLDEYGDALDADTTTKIRDYFSGASKSYEDMLNAYKSDTDYWSKWETEDDYNAAVKATEEYEGMKAADTNALSAEIETMKKVVPNAKKIKEKLDSFGDLNDTQKEALGGERWYEQQSKYLNDILSKYGYSSVDELESGLTEKEVYYNNATRIQKGIEMSSVSDPNADNYDPDFDTKAKAGEEKGLETHKALVGTDGHVDTWGKDVNDYIIAFRNKRNEEGVPLHTFNGAVSGGGGLTREERFAWYMTDEEYETYCYYKSFGDEEADEYLDSIEEGVNQRDAARIVDAVGDSTTIKLVFAAAAGGDQFSSGIKNLFDDRSYIPSSPVQIASGEIRDSLDDTGPDILGSSLGQIGYDVINTGANMLPSILVSTAVGYINPVAGAVVGNTLMGASAAGNARQQMLNLGYNEDNANAYAMLVGSSEALMQYALGGISKLGGVAASKIGLKLLSSVDNAFARFAINYGKSFVSEGIEESLQEILTPYFENLALNANNDWSDIDWQEAAYSGLLGALSAGILEGGSVASAEVNTYKEGKAVKDAGQTSNLVKLGKSFSADTVAFRLAGKVNENTGAYTIGRLLHEAGADSLSDTNMADIVKSLTRKGISPSHAQTIAKWMNKAVEGGNLTRLQAKALESNEYIAAAFRDVIVNPNSTVNQRIQGRNSILQSVAQYRADVEAGKVAKTTDKAVEKTGNVAESSDTNSSQPFVPYSNEEMARRTAEGEYVVDSNGEKIVVADNHFDVSADGKTINTKTGETVEVKEIASIKDGKMNLRLENGDVVSIEDVSFPSKDEGIIYSAVMDMGINTEGANSLVKAFDSSKLSAARYAYGIKEAYKYGRYNYSDDSMFKKGFSADLTEEQRRIAYEHGRIDEKARVAKKQAEIDAKEKTVTKKEGVKGAVHFDGDKMKLDKTRRVSLEVMEDLAHRLGINFYVYESFKKDGKYYYKDADGKVKPAPHGKYDPNTGAIYIDLNAGVDGKGTMLYTVAHELTHFIRDWSPAKFKVLADFLMEQYGKNDVSVDALVDKQIKKAKENNRTIDYDTAFEEVVADSMETMLTDGNLAKSLAAIKQKDKGLFNAIKRFFDKWAKIIKDAYAQYSPNSLEGQTVAKWKDSIEQIQALFVEGLVDASESYAAADTQVQKNTTEDGGVMYHSRGEVLSWDIDWDDDNFSSLKSQLQKHLDEVNAMKPVTSVNYDKNAGKPYYEVLDEILRTRFGYKIERQDYGSINFDEKAIQGVRKYVKTDAEAAAIIASPYVLKRGKAITGQKNHKNEGYPSVTFAAPATLNGKTGNIAVAVLYGAAERIHSLRVLTPDGTVFVLEKIKDTEPQNAGSTTNGVDSAIGSMSDKIVTHPEGKVKEKRSDRDSKDRTLTKEQVDFFKDSAVRDENGNLLVMYQGGAGDFTVFDRKKSKPSNLYGRGFYFTNSEAHAKQYGTLREFYLDIKTPLMPDQHNLTKDQVLRFLEAVEENGEDYDLYNYGENATAKSVLDIVWGKGDFDMLQDISASAVGDLVAAVELFNEVNGTKYDGFILPTETVTFSSEQAKLTTNKAPTKDQDIRYMEREVTTLNESDYRKLEKHFGTTANYNVAGYMLTNGKILDFSGKHWGDTKSTFRQVDHRDVWDVWENSDKDGVDEMVNMIGNGNIRLMPEIGGINLAVAPNELQRKELIGYIRHFKGEVVVDVDAVGGDTIHTFNYNKGTAPMTVIRDIMAYFEDGTVPKEQPEYRKFLYSDRDSTGKTLTKEQIVFFKDSKVRDDNGRLLVVHRGSPEDFGTVFKFLDENLNSKDQANTFGFFFTDSYDTAEYYSKARGNDGDIKSVYLNINNPIDLTSLGISSSEKEFYHLLEEFGVITGRSRYKQDYKPVWTRFDKNGEDLRRRIEAAGFDGVVYHDWGENKATYVAFSPEQIKLTTNTNPTIDPDIRYQDRDPEVEKAYEDVNKQLTKENAKLKEDVASLKELLKIQKTVTHGKTFSKTSIEAVAGRIMRYANANGDVNELVSHLTDTYSYIISGEDVSWEGIAEKAQDAVDWLRSHEKHTRQRDEYADEVLKDLRSRRISLDDQQQQEGTARTGQYDPVAS